MFNFEHSFDVLNSYFSFSSLFAFFFLFVFFYFLEKKDLKINFIFCSSFILKLILGKLIADAGGISDDTFRFYDESRKVLEDGHQSGYAYNFYYNFSFLVYKHLGLDLVSMRTVLTTIATLSTYCAFLTIDQYNKKTSRCKLAFLVFFFPPTFIISTIPFKENLISSLYLFCASFFKSYQKNKFLCSVLTLVSLALGFKCRETVFIFPIFLFILYVVHDVTKSLSLKLRTIGYTLLCLTSLTLFFQSKGHWGIHSIRDLLKLQRKRHRVIKNDWKEVSLDQKRKVQKESSSLNYINIHLLDYSLLIYPMAIARGLVSPSPLKVLRDFLRKKDQIQLSSIIDSFIHAVFWILLFPFFLKALILSLENRDSFLFFISATFIFAHSLVSLNDVLWVPQFVRYRLGGLSLFFLAAIIGLLNEKSLWWDKLKTPIVATWVLSQVAANSIYFFI